MAVVGLSENRMNEMSKARSTLVAIAIPDASAPGPDLISESIADSPIDAAKHREIMRLRRVHRAMSELRRGTPILMTGPAPLVLLAADTAGASGLADFARLAASPPVLLLSPIRAAAVLGRAVDSDLSAIALALSDQLLAPEILRRLADPTADQMLPELPRQVAAPPATAAAAALSLVKLARLLPAVLAASVGVVPVFRADQLGLLSVPIEDVLAYPLASALGLRSVAEASVPLQHAGECRIRAFRAPDAGIEHLAILVGRPEDVASPLVRLHSECFTGDLLGSLRCDCGEQLRGAIARMGAEGAGVLLYLAQEGRGIGLVNKLRAYALQDRGLDTVDANRALGWGADERNFMIAATMLETLGIPRIRLLTNNPDKMSALAACGVQVDSREAHSFAPNGVNDDYLATKAKRFGHLLD